MAIWDRKTICTLYCLRALVCQAELHTNRNIHTQTFLLTYDTNLTSLIYFCTLTNLSVIDIHCRLLNERQFRTIEYVLDNIIYIYYISFPAIVKLTYLLPLLPSCSIFLEENRKKRKGKILKDCKA